MCFLFIYFQFAYLWADNYSGQTSAATESIGLILLVSVAVARDNFQLECQAQCPDPLPTAARNATRQFADAPLGLYTISYFNDQFTFHV